MGMEVSGPIRRSVAKQTEEGRQARNTVCKKHGGAGQERCLQRTGSGRTKSCGEKPWHKNTEADSNKVRTATVLVFTTSTCQVTQWEELALS